MLGFVMVWEENAFESEGTPRPSPGLSELGFLCRLRELRLAPWKPALGDLARSPLSSSRFRFEPKLPALDGMGRGESRALPALRSEEGGQAGGQGCQVT